MKIIDLTGKKYGDFIITGRVKRKNDKYHYWNCRCKCGKDVILNSYYIRNIWKPKDCGCSSSLVGRSFGKLKVIEKLGVKSNTVSNYLCQCECGKTKKYRGTSLLHREVKSCGCARVHGIKENGVRLVWTAYKTNARKRKLEFTLSHQQFETLITSACFYCKKTCTNTRKLYKSLFLNERTFLHNGIDRMDNSQGYTPQNTVSCCKLCNHMKWHISFKEWIGHMKLILKNIESYQQA